MSTEPPLTDDEISAVAEQLKEHSGVYTRRDIIAAAATTGSLGVLGALGIDSAEASHGIGRIGEPGDPLDAAYVSSIDGDGDTVDIGPAVGTGEVNTTFYTAHRGSGGSAIQEALNAARDANGLARVVIDPIDTAPYVVSNAPLVVYDDTVVEICEDVKLDAGQDHNLFETEGCHGTSPTVRDNVHFVGAGGELDGNDANNTASKSPAGFYANCINLMATNSSVVGVQMVNPVWHGVNIHGYSQEVLVRDCYLDGGKGGYQAHWHEADNTPWDDVRFVDNTSVNGGSSGNGLIVSGGTNAVVRGNTIRNASNDGIQVYNGDVALGLDAVQVSGNTVLDAGRHAIRAVTSGSSGTGLNDITLTDNVLVNAGASGVILEPDATPIDEVTVSGNSIRAAADRGILLLDNQSGAGPGTENVVIESNVIDGTTNWSGIQIAYDSSNDTEVTDNIVQDAGYHGIQASGTQAVIDGNQVSGCQRRGIDVNDPDHVVTNNIAKNNGQSGNNPDGIGLDANEILCNGNRCYDDQGTATQQNGVNIVSGDYQIISDNILRGNGTAGISGTVGTNTIETDNVT